MAEAPAPAKPNLAFYTCFFGSDWNWSKIIPPLPSSEYDCYFFTNNEKTLKDLKTRGWKPVFLESVPVYNCNIKDCMSVKELKSCPHHFKILDQYDFTCYFDTKLSVDAEKVVDLALQLAAEPSKFLVMARHPHPNTSVWDEFWESMKHDKYKEQKFKMFDYIKDCVEKRGFSEAITNHWACGFILRKRSDFTQLVGELWLEHIQRCGIQDQVSFDMVQQRCAGGILPIEFLSCFNWFYG